MSERGVFAIDRGIWDDPDFRDEPFTQREAWMWLVGAAAWKDIVIRGSAGPLKLSRGEFSFSVRFLAKRFSWSSSRCGRVLDMLKKRDMIRDTSRDGSKVYLIKNYSKFQVVSLPKRDTLRDSERDTSGTAAGQQRDKEETIRNHYKPLEEKKEASKARSHGCSIPGNWFPDENLILWANSEGFSNAVIFREAETMRDWALANKNRAIARKADWNLTFKNWMKKLRDRGGVGPPAKEKHFREAVREHLEEVDRANIVELRPGRRELRGPDSECSAGEFHATAARYEIHAPAAHGALYGQAQGGSDEDGSS